MSLSLFALTLPGTASGRTASAKPAAGQADLSSSEDGQDIGRARQAFRALDRGQIGEAERLTAGIRSRDLKDALDAELFVRASADYSYQQIGTFYVQHPVWPGRQDLLHAIEARMPPGFPDQDVIAWFDANPPSTLNGFERYAGALSHMGDQDKLAEQAHLYFIKGGMSGPDEAEFRLDFGSILTRGDYEARFDHLMWEGEYQAARRLLPYLGSDSSAQILGRARLALALGEPGAEALIDRLPSGDRDDPGLLYERLHWRRTHDQTDGAIDILRHVPEDVPHADLWWTERQIIARRALAQGDADTAYRLAAEHGELSGENFVEAEWLAGWIALRNLKDDGAAEKHFRALYQAANFPSSKARGAYWLGRTAEAVGNTTAASQWYQEASVYNLTFYGQLAAAKLSPDAEIVVHPEPDLPPEWVHDYMAGELPHLVVLLHRLGEDGRAGNYLHALANAATERAEFVELAHMASDIERPDLQVQIFKLAAQKDMIIAAEGYPLLRPHLIPAANALEPALVHALIRQESMFRTSAASSAGALGAMQLMPATAKGVARSLGVRFSEQRLASDYVYNIKLGSTYIARTIGEFGGSYILAIAAYNAGAGRVHEWCSMFGDPRNASVDPVDWIESIPVAETRNYVERVIEGTEIYRARLKHGIAPLDIDYDLHRAAMHS